MLLVADATPSTITPSTISTPSPPATHHARTSKRAVDWLLEGESVKTNRHLRRFAAAPYLQRLLAEPSCDALLRRKSKALRKELIEAYAVRAHVMSRLAMDGFRHATHAGPARWALLAKAHPPDGPCLRNSHTTLPTFDRAVGHRGNRGEPARRDAPGRAR